MKSAILVNGVPASGKSTVARGLAERTGLPLLTLDTVKTPLFEHFGIGDREHNRMLGRVSYAIIFAAIGDWPNGSIAIVDCWFGFQPREILEQHLATAGITRTAEVWCHAPDDVVAARYHARLGDRSAGHPGADYIPELIALNRRAKAVDRGPRLDVATTGDIPFDAILAWLRAGHIATLR